MASSFKSLALGLLGGVLMSGAAGAVTLDASSWIDADDPIKENQSGVSETGDGYVYIHGNGDLAVVTDYTITGAFDFSGTVKAPGDDDILGLVFGYQGGQTNYRISWTGGEDHDWEPGARYGGLLLVKEQESPRITDVLFHDASLLWKAGIAYDFSLSVAASQISFELRQDGAQLTRFSVMGDFAGISGHVGVFTRSNGAHFTNLDDEPLPPLVTTPLPGGLSLMLGGAGLLLVLKRRRRS